MNQIFLVGLVGLGGGLGAIMRYALGGWVLHHSENARFPVSTFVINILGCLAAGLLTGLAEKYGLFSEQGKTFLFTGILGGFTTYSAFGLETTLLLRRGEYGIAAAYVSLSLAVGVAALWMGIRAIELMAN
ncbi:MAG: fluoride efflux transporter CrcB [Phycisphaeraceae bacterium]|nr:fluoride efflux transporter CrcB [Phycisphaeraceae bacterium]